MEVVDIYNGNIRRMRELVLLSLNVFVACGHYLPLLLLFSSWLRYLYAHPVFLSILAALCVLLLDCFCGCFGCNEITWWAACNELIFF